MNKIELITNAATTTVTMKANDYYQLVQMVKEAEAIIQDLLTDMTLHVEFSGSYSDVRVPLPGIPKTLEQRVIDQTVDMLLSDRTALAYLVERKKQYLNMRDGAFDDWNFNDNKIDLLGIERLKDRWYEVELDLLFPAEDVVDDSAKEEM